MSNHSFPHYSRNRRDPATNLPTYDTLGAALVSEMGELMRNVALAGRRSRRPDLTAEELSRELMPL